MTARYLAVRALLHQEQDGYANLVLDAELKACQPPLELRDAAFCARIFYTVLERRNLLDFCLSQFCKKPLVKLDAPVLAILRAGLAQARYMDVPESAAVNESVKLTRAFGKSSAAGMVNAILRRAVVFDEQSAKFESSEKKLSVLGSVSPEISHLLLTQYGDEAFDMVSACRPPEHTCIRINTLRTKDDTLSEMLQQQDCKVTPGPWEHCLLVDFPASPAQTNAFRQGLFHVQGTASQWAALCLDAQPGMRVLDLCAAPGGKSLTVAQQMQNKGELISCDVSANRVALIQKALERCGVTVAKAVQNDATTVNPALGQFDRILCDVPCSGLGILSKKPDIRYKTLQSLPQLLCCQQEILQNAAAALAENGLLVYSTCTVNQNENEKQVAHFLQNNKDFCLVPPKFSPQGAVSTEFGTLLLPNKTATDGFFVAILSKEMS